MIQSIKANSIRTLLLLLSFALLLSIYACGGSMEEDDTGTPSGSGLQITLSASSSTLSAGQSTVVTAKVTDSLGAAVQNKTINFACTGGSCPSGGTITAVNGGVTDAGGQAVAIYKAGTTTSALSLEDTITATSGKSSALVVITRTAGTATTLQVTMSAAATSLSAGQNTIITATVTNGSGSPVQGITVTFDKPIDHSTMTLAAIGGGLTATTDASGKAQALYTAGSTNSTVDVQDTVITSINNGASYAAVVITRIGTTTPATGYTMSLTANLTSLSAGEHSIITVGVKDSAGNNISGMNVTFTFVPGPTSPIGSTLNGSTTTASGKTDAGGIFTTTYAAGSGLTGSVQDTIQASVNGVGCTTCQGCDTTSVRAIIITRTAENTSADGYRMKLTATQYSLASEQNSIITATVTDGLDAPVIGRTVSFDFVPGPTSAISSSLSPVSGPTDASGRFSTSYKAGSGSSGTTVQETIRASVNDGTFSSSEAVIITRTATPGLQIVSFAGSPTSLGANRSSILTAQVTDGSGVALRDQTVIFTCAGGPTCASGGSIAPTMTHVTTDAGGYAVTVYTAGNNQSTAELDDNIVATCGTYTKATTIKRTAGSASGNIISIKAREESLKAGGSTIITATVTDGNLKPVSGAGVAFTIPVSPSGASAPTVVSGSTDANGQAVAIYTAGSNSLTTTVQDTVQASGAGTAAAVVITRTAGDGIGYTVSLEAAPPYLEPTQNSILTATVKDGSGHAAGGVQVTFSYLIDQSGFRLNNGTANVTRTTDVNGKAVIIYTAGSSSPTLNLQDTIRARAYDATYSSTDAVIINRTAQSSVPPVGLTMTLAPDLLSLSAGKRSTITATVNDRYGKPASWLLVTFTIAPNPSGANLRDIDETAATTVTGRTDASGRVTAIYTAGNNGSNERYDVVQASVSDGPYSTAAASIITRLASTVIPTGYSLTLEPTPSSLPANAFSVLLAKVKNADGSAAQGLDVTFTLGPRPSGARLFDVDAGTSSITSVTGFTDANGEAIALYRAGDTSPALSVQDAVSASVTGASDSYIITRLPTAGTGKRIISFTQMPETSQGVPIAPPWNDVVMKVKVTTDDGTTPVANEPVDFSIIYGTGMLTDPDDASTAGYGTSPITVITDNNGEAWASFRRPASGTGDTVIRAQIYGTTNGGDVASIVYWTDVVPGP